MKKTGIIFNLILIALLYGTTLTAQRIEFYTYNLPTQLLPTGGKVYVQDLVNTGTSEAEYGNLYARHLIGALKSSSHGLNKDVKLYNPWLTTKLYEVVDNADEADYIIGGDYKITSSSDESYQENWIAETDTELKNKLPICYYKHTMTNVANIEGKLVVSKKDGSPIDLFPLTFSSKDSDTKIMKKATAKNVSKLIGNVSNMGINKYKYAFTPSLEIEKYKFQNVKTKNKEIKADFKEIDKQIEALIKIGDFNETGKKYLELAAKEESEDVNQNIAVCYEIIGNFTKAKEYYIKAADKNGLARITKMIKVQDQLRAFGITIIENEF